MKYTYLICLFLLSLSAQSQLKVQEIAVAHLGQSSFIPETEKKANQLFYNIALLDSIMIADTIFRNPDATPRTLWISYKLPKKIDWFLSFEGGDYRKAFKSGNRILQTAKFTSTSYQLNGFTLLNTNAEKSWAIVMIDSNGLNLNVLKIGNELKNQTNSWLYINSLSINSSGNIVVSGYQRGTVNLGGTDYSSDTGLSSYFMAEYNNTGTITKYKTLFKAQFPHIISNTIEYQNNLYFETGFDSLEIKNKVYSSLNFKGNKTNDLALIQLNKDSLSLINYAIMQDSTNNYQSSGRSIKVNDYGVLWAISTTVANIKINDTILHANNEIDDMILILKPDNFSFMRAFSLKSEIPASKDIDVFNDSAYIITYRNPGTYMSFNDYQILNPDVTATIFIVIEPKRLPYRIFSVKGVNYGAKLTQFSKSRLEMIGNLVTATGQFTAKSQTISRAPNHLEWPAQSTYYIMEEFSAINTPNTPLMISIFPNPAKNIFQIHLKDSKLKTFKVAIYDQQARQVFQSELTDTLQVETQVWSNGLYHIVLIGNEGQLYTYRILINN